MRHITFNRHLFRKSVWSRCLARCLAHHLSGCAKEKTKKSPQIFSLEDDLPNLQRESHPPYDVIGNLQKKCQISMFDYIILISQVVFICCSNPPLMTSILCEKCPSLPVTSKLGQSDFTLWDFVWLPIWQVTGKRGMDKHTIYIHMHP